MDGDDELNGNQSIIGLVTGKKKKMVGVFF
jgi:hypothetical protein